MLKCLYTIQAFQSCSNRYDGLKNFFKEYQLFALLKFCQKADLYAQIPAFEY